MRGYYSMRSYNNYKVPLETFIISKVCCVYCKREWINKKSLKRFLLDGTCIHKESDLYKKWRNNNNSRRYNEQNKDKIKKKRRIYYEKNKDKIKKYREDNKEHLKKLNKEWRKKNKEKRALYKKKLHIIKNKDAIDKRNKKNEEYLKTHDDKYKCVCGSVIKKKKYNIARHEQSKTHQKYLS